jgi:hypothetical protein
MCHFLYIRLNDETKAKLPVLPAQYTISPIETTPLDHRFAGARISEICRGTCACGVLQELSDRKLTALRRKYSKRGWSPERIESVMADKNADGYVGRLDPELRAWISAVVEATGDIQFVVHWFDTPACEIAELRMPLRDFSDTGFDIVENTIYTVLAPAKRNARGH